MDKVKHMDISYHREMKNNYLMITVEEARERGFEARMLIGNTIDGLLKFRIRKSDNQCQFCYEITSRQPLGRLLETKTISAEQLRRLLLGIAQTLTRMEDYLLTEEQILLDPDFIYVELESFQPGLCLLPGRRGDFPQEFSELLRFLLGKVDHQDKEAVILIYGLYRESLKDNYGLDNLLRWLIKEERPNGEGEKQDRSAEKPEMVYKTGFTPQEPEKPEMMLWERAKDDSSRNNGFIRSPDFPRKAVIAWILIIPLMLIFFWLQKGKEGVHLYVTSGILGGTVLISAAGVGFSIWKWRRNWAEYMAVQGEDAPLKPEDTTMQSEAKPPSWTMVFSEEEPEYEEEKEADDDSTHTVLLWSRESNESQRRLIPENRMTESIVITYYPFLIGKQESLVDCVIREDGVSRLHVRIDQIDGEYFLTDLNSTNGTSINGRKLEANETVKLNVGDQVGIAHLVYCFQ